MSRHEDPTLEEALDDLRAAIAQVFVDLEVALLKREYPDQHPLVLDVAGGADDPSMTEEAARYLLKMTGASAIYYRDALEQRRRLEGPPAPRRRRWTLLRKAAAGAVRLIEGP